MSSLELLYTKKIPENSSDIHSYQVSDLTVQELRPQRFPNVDEAHLAVFCPVSLGV